MKGMLSVSVVVGLALGLGAAPAAAAPPPTLTGQAFGGSYYPGIQFNMSMSCTENGDGTTTISWRTEPQASGGSYPGQDQETGEMRIRRDAPNSQVDVLSLKADFTVDSTTGQVSGTKRLTAPVMDVTGVALCDQQEFEVDIAPITVPYTATIINSQGVFTDRGTARHSFADQSPNPGSPTDLDERLTSSLSAPEQNESALFGPRVPGGSFSAMSANAKRASPFTLYFAGTVRKLYAYIDGKGAGSGSQTVRGLLYRNGPGNVPGALVAPTFQFSVPAGMSSRWVPLYLAPPTKLNPGVYWLGLQSDATNRVSRFAWSSKPGSRRSNIDGFADGPSDPFGTAALDDQQMSIFAAGSY